MPRHARPMTVLPVVLRELEVLRVWDVIPGKRQPRLSGREAPPER